MIAQTQLLFLSKHVLYRTHNMCALSLILAVKAIKRADHIPEYFKQLYLSMLSEFNNITLYKHFFNEDNSRPKHKLIPQLHKTFEYKDKLIQHTFEHTKLHRMKKRKVTQNVYKCIKDTQIGHHEQSYLCNICHTSLFFSHICVIFATLLSVSIRAGWYTSASETTCSACSNTYLQSPMRTTSSHNFGFINYQ